MATRSTARASGASVFGKRFRQARLRAGLSQKAVGIAAGFDEFVASPRINQYERGVHQPDYRTAQRLAKVLGVTTAYFYADDEDVATLLIGLGGLSGRKRRRVLRSVRS